MPDLHPGPEQQPNSPDDALDRSRGGYPQPIPASVCPIAVLTESPGPAQRVDDDQLITRILAGDAPAERAFHDRHVDRVHRLTCRLAGGDPDLAQDFTQETFLRAFDRLGGFRGDSDFGLGRSASPTVSPVLQPLRGRAADRNPLPRPPRPARPTRRALSPERRRGAPRRPAPGRAHRRHRPDRRLGARAARDDPAPYHQTIGWGPRAR